MSLPQKLTRRTIFFGSALSFMFPRGASTALVQPDGFSSEIAPGIEVRDARIVESKGTLRFLVDLFNSTSDAVDTPSVGVVLPHLDSVENFGWATPLQGVMHPRSSTGLIGVAPAGIKDDSDWGDPDWMVCGPIETTEAERIARWDVDCTYSIEIRDTNDLVATITVTNNGMPLPDDVTVTGIVRDSDGRICGSTVAIHINTIEPGTSVPLPVRVGPTVDYISNPSPLMDTDKGVTIDFSLQPWTGPINQGCAPIMPWNR